MSEQPETAPEVQAPIMTEAEVDAAQLPPRTTEHKCLAGYCQTCGTFNANRTA